MTTPHSHSSTPVPSGPSAKSEPKRSRWVSGGLFVGALLGVSIGLGVGVFDFFDWAGGWTFSDLNMSVAAQPLATILAASGVIVTARIALHNGEAIRKHEREMQEQAAKRDTERSLRDRFFKVTETLSEGTNYVKREAGVYALVALADDWAVFHRDNPEAAKREQQTCLNVITGQLRDPLSIASPSTHPGLSPAGGAQHKGEQPKHDPVLLTFKHRVQDITLERFRPSDGRETGVWSHLDLQLSNCHLHEMSADRVIVQGDASFNNAHFHGDAWFQDTHFHTIPSFVDAHFHGTAWFDEAHFHGTARFNSAHFHDGASFGDAVFHDSASFFYAHFHVFAWFDRAHFHGTARFDELYFHGTARFNSAHFCTPSAWRETDIRESRIDFTDVRFRAEKATALERNDADVSGKVLENAHFSAGCPFNSPEAKKQVEIRP